MEHRSVQPSRDDPSYVCHIDKGKISKLEGEEKVTISRPTNHNEISIMEGDWDLLREKVDAIQIGGSIDFRNLVLGALVSCLLGVAADIFSKNAVNWFPTALCGIVYIICFECQRIPWVYQNKHFNFLIDKTPENRVHHKDLHNTIERIQAKRNTIKDPEKEE